MKKSLCVFSVALLVALAGVSAYAQAKDSLPTQSSGQLASASITVKGIRCNGCVNRVQDALKALDGVSSVKMTKKDFKRKTGVVDVSYASAKLSVNDIENAISDLGFDAGATKSTKSHEQMEKDQGKGCGVEKDCEKSDDCCGGKGETDSKTQKCCDKHHK
jgi:copper chaperone